MRHYRIVNNFRFTCFVLIICLILSFVILGFVCRSSAKERMDLRYTEVTVNAGDTLWAIAKEYGDDSKDIRDVVYDICSLNGIKASDLRPGQVILVPEND